MTRPRLLSQILAATWGSSLACCGPKIVSEATEATTAGDASGTIHLTEGGSETTLAPTSAEITGTGFQGSTGALSSTTEDGSATHSSGDTGDDDVPCDPFVHECPPGTKCALVDPEGWGDLSDYLCRPLSPDPKQLYEECSIADGTDDCDDQLVCWSPFNDGIGVCYGLCIGTFLDPGCVDPEGFCAIYGNSIAVCFPTCHPLGDECAEGELCVPTGDWTRCLADNSALSGGLYAACESPFDCEAGFQCIESDALASCDSEFPGCCVPWCDLSQEDMCPDDLACEPWWEPGTEHPGAVNLGFCNVQ